MSRCLLILGFLLAGSALAAGPQSTLVAATFVDGAQVVTSSPDLGSFPDSVNALAQSVGGNCAKSEFVAWKTETERGSAVWRNAGYAGIHLRGAEHK